MARTRVWHLRKAGGRSYEYRVRIGLTKMLVPVSCSAIMVLIALFQVGAAHGRVAAELEMELNTLSTLRSDLAEAGHLVEDYAITSRDDIRAEYELLATAIERNLERIEAFDEEEEVRLGDVATAAWNKGRRAADRVFTADTRSQAAAVAHGIEGQFALAASRIAELDAASRSELQATSERSADTSRIVIALALAVGTIATTINMALVRRLLKATFGPLRHLTDSVRRFSADDLTHRIGLTGDDEFRAVGEAFNAMADRLEDTFTSLQHQAFHDALTGLPNRAGLLRHLLTPGSGQRSIVLFDLDDFKEVNDGLGHGSGDEALYHLARRLTRVVRAGDFLARLGGDEFVVVLNDISLDDTVAVGEALSAEISRPFEVAGRSVVLHASTGIAPVHPGATPADALRSADVALYAAKAAGKQCVRLYSDEMLSDVEARLSIATDLRGALDRGEITVHYQPTVSTETGAVHGVEALMRWTHPERGAVPPFSFIPVAEETGAIVTLGRYVLDTACRQGKAWQQLPGLEQLRMNVNVSATQLQTADIVAEVAQALAESDLAPACLTLEVTESVMACPDAITRIHELKALGVSIALDDFGTGYSSLGYLQHLPIDVLKIDKSFVDDIDLRADRSELAGGIVRLGRSLGMVTVAEGVERPDQLKALGAAGCDVIQGYLFARPQPAADAERRLLELVRLAATAPPDVLEESSWVRVAAGPLDIVGARDWLHHAHGVLDEIEAGHVVVDGVSTAGVAMMRDFVDRWSVAALDHDAFVWCADEDAELLGIMMGQWRRVSRVLVDAANRGALSISPEAAAFSQALAHSILIALADHRAGARPAPAVLAQHWPNRVTAA